MSLSDRLPDKKARLERASASVLRADKFRAFMGDADIAAFLAAYEKDQIRKMLTAPLADDASRREAAVAINAMREFIAFVSSAISAGDKSAIILSEASPHA